MTYTSSVYYSSRRLIRPPQDRTLLVLLTEVHYKACVCYGDKSGPTCDGLLKIIGFINRGFIRRKLLTVLLFHWLRKKENLGVHAMKRVATSTRLPMIG